MINKYEWQIERIKIKPYCTVQDAELITGESRPTLIRRIKTGDLKAYKRSGGRKWVIRQEDLRSYLES